MKKWIILSTIKLDGVRIKPGGEPVEIEDDDLAEQYQGLGCIEAAPAKEAEKDDKSQRPGRKADRLTAIQTMIGEMDLGDEVNVTQDGLPDATVLTDRLGWQVEAKERDEAWAAFQKAKADNK